MTICIGILATGGTSIVCVADKSATHSDDIQGDTDSSKIVPVGKTGCHALISGSEGTTSRILAKLNANDDFGKDLANSKLLCEKAYREAESEILEATFLHPFLKIEDYNTAVLKEKVNPVIKSIAENIERAREEQVPVSCGLLICGFDESERAYLLQLEYPGLCTDMTHAGLCVAGSGSKYALQKLLSHEWDRSRLIDRTLYECFDAKASAELDPYVGLDWDAFVLRKDKITQVPKSIKTMIDRAWTQHVRSPFETYVEEEDLPPPPSNWKDRLQKYGESIMPSASQT